MKKFFKKIENQEELRKWLIAGVSPLGVFLPAILLYVFGICNDVAGEPSCVLDILEFYPISVVMVVSLSMYFGGFGLLLIASSIIIWLKIFSYFIRVYLSKKPQLSSILLKVRFVALAAALATAVTLVMIFFLT